jgi:hypothetical protein
MRTKAITVGYGQTLKGDARFEMERFDMSVTVEAETEEEADPRRMKKYGEKMFKEVMKAVEAKSGRKMRRRKVDQ